MFYYRYTRHVVCDMKSWVAFRWCVCVRCTHIVHVLCQSCVRVGGVGLFGTHVCHMHVVCVCVRTARTPVRANATVHPISRTLACTVHAHEAPARGAA